MSNVHEFPGPRQEPLGPRQDEAPLDPPPPPPREAAVNLPGVVLGSIGVLFAIHLARQALSAPVDFEVVLLFAFLPLRYLAPDLLPGGLGSAVWSPVTYSLLHGSWMHVIVNCVWLAAFGAAVARRFGAGRFLAFCALTAVGGAAAHLLSHWGEPVPMVGASGAVSGLTAGALRFAFGPGGPLSRFGASDGAVYRRPAEPLVKALSDRRALVFLAVWFGINLATGAGALVSDGAATIAWQAHIGGFLAGLALFPLFDPVGRAPR